MGSGLTGAGDELELVTMRTLTILAMLVVIAGCSTTATIYKKDGTTVEAEVRRSDAHHIFALVDGSSYQFDEVHRLKEKHPGSIVVDKLVQRCMTDRIENCKKDCKRKYVPLSKRKKRKNCFKGCQSDASHRPDCEADSTEIPIARLDIKEIDHPGNVSAMVGTSVAVVGWGVALAFWSVVNDCDNDCVIGEKTVRGLIGIPFAIAASIGTIVGIAGWVSWSKSRDAAMQPKKPAGPKIRPVALSDGENTYYGLGISWRW